MLFLIVSLVKCVFQLLILFSFLFLFITFVKEFKKEIEDEPVPEKSKELSTKQKMKIIAWIVAILCFLFLVNCLMFSLAKPIGMFHYQIELRENDAVGMGKWQKILIQF